MRSQTAAGRGGRTHARYVGLDGIKGFALIGIIWYHLSQSTLPGGFIGVDTFFVVSGFLLTTGLLREIDDAGRISVGRFYLRRLARLWPGMMFMVVSVISLGFLIDRDLLVGARVKSVGAAVFASNWVDSASGGSYFDAVTPQPLKHLWFVALLAQMTVLLPLLVAILRRFVPSSLRVVVVMALAVLSALAMGLLFDPEGDPTRVYYGTDTHCFGMLLGVAFGFCLHRDKSADTRSPRIDGRWISAIRTLKVGRRILPWLSMAALVGLIVLAPRMGQDISAFRGGLFMAAVLSVMLIAGTIMEGSWMQNLFTWRPLVLLGRYSYGIYLWHWPMFLFARQMLPGLRSRGMWVIILLTLAASVLATALSWWMIERPVSSWVGRLAARPHGWERNAPGNVTAKSRTVSSGAEGIQTDGGVSVVVPASDMPSAPSSFLPETRDAASDSAVMHVRMPSWLRAAVTIPVVVLVIAGFAAGLVHAPEHSSIEITLERNQRALDAQSAKRAHDAKAAAEAKKRAEEERKRREAAQAKVAKTLTGDQVTVIGDSVTVGSSPALQSALPGIVIDAQVSRSIAAAPDIIAQLKGQGQLRRFVVVSLNTNSAPTVDDFSQLAEEAGDGHVLVIVNGYGDRSWIPPANQAAADYVRSHPADAVLADWNTAIAAHPEMLSADGIHPQPQGQDLYAATIKNAISSWMADQLLADGQ